MSVSAQELSTVDQHALWNDQHAARGGQGGLEGGDALVDIPNDAAVLLNELLPPASTIAEVGSANGRDARYWAGQGHLVHCLDFSEVAHAQLVQHALRQGVAERVNPLLFDANIGKLPKGVGEIDGFYARSALHVDDDTLMDLLGDVDHHMRPNGVVVIEGKTTDDPKIARSKKLGNGLAVDGHEKGHVRRIWTPESAAEICSAFGWTAVQQEVVGERWAGSDASFLRLVATK